MMCFWDLMNSTASLCLRFSKFFPFTSINWSPTLNPAFSAGEPRSTLQNFDQKQKLLPSGTPWLQFKLHLDFVRSHPCYLFMSKQYYSLKMVIKHNAWVKTGTGIISERDNRSANRHEKARDLKDMQLKGRAKNVIFCVNLALHVLSILRMFTCFVCSFVSQQN